MTYPCATRGPTPPKDPMGPAEALPDCGTHGPTPPKDPLGIGPDENNSPPKDQHDANSYQDGREY